MGSLSLQNLVSRPLSEEVQLDERKKELRVSDDEENFVSPSNRSNNRFNREIDTENNRRGAGKSPANDKQNETSVAKKCLAIGLAMLVLVPTVYGLIYDANQNFRFMNQATPIIDIPNYSSLLLGVAFCCVALLAYKKIKPAIPCFNQESSCCVS